MPKESIPVAIYTRKSKDISLDDEVHSLSVQRDMAESYVASQLHLGWCLIDEHFDDANIVGDTLDRPALQRLKARIEVGDVKVVVVNRLDRISRSLSQFMELTQFFDKHGVTLVSSTQNFKTDDTTGNLMRHILLSFAEFEHGLIRTRINERIYAARKGGNFKGAQPMLGYDVVPYSGKLVVNKPEAQRVQEIFRLYLELKSVRATASELKRRGWNNKQWLTKQDKPRGGGPFSVNGLHKLLTNPIYMGQVRIKDEVFAGEHPPIIDQSLFEAVQNMLHKNRQCDASHRVRRESALLHGMLDCPCCNARYVHHTTKRGSIIHRYYSCGNQRSNGVEACDAPTLRAGTIEGLVVKELMRVISDPDLRKQVVQQVQLEAEASGITDSIPTYDKLDTVLVAMSGINYLTEPSKFVRPLLSRVQLDNSYEKMILHFKAEEIVRRASL